MLPSTSKHLLNPLLLLIVWAIFQPSVNQAANLTVVVRNAEMQPIKDAVLFIDDRIERITDEYGSALFDLPENTYMLYTYASGYRDYASRIILKSDTIIEIIKQNAVFWSTAPANPPIGVGEMNGVRLAAAGGKIYMHTAYGGIPGTNTTSARSEFLVYDPLSDKWSELKNAPHFGQYGISIAHGPTLDGKDALYIIRGYWSGQRTWFARYNIESAIWETGLDHKIPWRTDLAKPYSGSGFQDYPRNGAVMIWDQQDYIYFLPGSGYTYDARDWYRYSVSQNKWEDLGKLPYKQGPGNAAAFISAESSGLDQNYLYVHFGTSPSGNYTNAEFWRFAITDQKWEKLPKHNYGADDGAMLVWDGSSYIYHVPGAYQEQSWDKGLSQKRKMMRYSIRHNSWTYMENTPYNRWGGWDDGGGMVRIENTIFGLKGGCDVAWAGDTTKYSGGSIASNDFWSFSLIDSTTDVNLLQPEGSGSVFPAPGAYTFATATPVSFSAFADSGWVFKEWQINGQYYSDREILEIPVEKDFELKSIFVSNATNVREYVTHGISIEQANRMISIKSDHGGKVSIHDAGGKEISVLSLKEKTLRHHFQHKPGLYFVTVVSEKGEQVTKKVIIH
jgi:hypothetical protein